jgi:glycosyltransferase 2 family protein
MLDRRGLRVFVASLEERRARRASDAVLLLLSFAGLALLSLVAVPPSGFEAVLIDIAAAFPAVLDGLWALGIGLLGWAGAGIVVATVVWRRWALFRDIVVALAVAVAVGGLAGWLVEGTWELVWNAALTGDSYWVPWLRLTLPGSVVAVASPMLTRPIRRLGWLLLGGSVVAAVMLGAASPTLAAAALLIALIAAAVAHLLFGSSRGWPGLDDLEAGLRSLGVEVRHLDIARRQRAGVFVVDAIGADGRPLTAKVYGRDAVDTQVLATLWRAVWFRDQGASFRAGRLHQVQHEALLTLLAAQAGLPTQPVVTAGMTPDEDAVLVLGTRGEPMPPAWTDEHVHATWRALHTLHGAGIAHGQVDGDHLLVDGTGVGFVDYRGATLATGPLARRQDRVQALVGSMLGAGEDRATRIAVDVLGHEGLVELLPVLQADLITGAQRDALGDRDLDIDDMRERLATSVGVEAPELERLRRVSWRSLLQTGLLILAFLGLSALVAGLDLADLADQLAEASGWYLAAGLVIAQLPRLTQAVSALGASPEPIPLSRLYVLQLAQSYLGLAVPGAAGRVALNVRFFQRHGLPTGTALTVGAIDGFSGFVSQMTLFAAIFLFTDFTLDLDLDSGVASGVARLLAIVVLVGAAAVLTVAVVPRLRRLVVERVRGILSEAREALKGLASPRRLSLLLGGNLATEILFAVALGAFALALGYPIGLPELIFINVTVSLLAGMLPIPGGIGVAEGALMFGLARAGVPEATAFAIALSYRIATFYLPPAWGFFAFRWLERNKHL